MTAEALELLREFCVAVGLMSTFVAVVLIICAPFLLWSRWRRGHD